MDAPSTPSHPPTVSETWSSSVTETSSMAMLPSYRPSVCWETWTVVPSVLTTTTASGRQCSGSSDFTAPTTDRSSSSWKTVWSAFSILRRGPPSMDTVKFLWLSSEPEKICTVLPPTQFPEIFTSSRNAGAHASAPQYFFTLPLIKSSTSFVEVGYCGICMNVLQPIFQRSNFSPVMVVMCGSPSEDGGYEFGSREFGCREFGPRESGPRELGPMEFGSIPPISLNGQHILGPGAP
mmetsp:Transcript_25885/g.67882  ORF Transcript_25885/g.67882 Transcript_25885/m.67882 type:complete len:236 (+) Transcript_25885:290-997(+)